MPLLGSKRAQSVFLKIINEVRARRALALLGYVVMIEHIHFLMSEPNIGNPSVVMARRPHLVLSLPPDPANAQVFRSPHSLSNSSNDRRGCEIPLSFSSSRPCYLSFGTVLYVQS